MNRILTTLFALLLIQFLVVNKSYSADDEVDYLSVTSSDEEKIKSKLNWVAFKQQFFSCIFIAKDGFEKPTYLSSEKKENSKYIKDLSAQFELPYKHKNNEQLNLKFYFGPNHYKILKSYNAGFEELIPLGVFCVTLEERNADKLVIVQIIFIFI